MGILSAVEGPFVLFRIVWALEFSIKVASRADPWPRDTPALVILITYQNSEIYYVPMMWRPGIQTKQEFNLSECNVQGRSENSLPPISTLSSSRFRSDWDFVLNTIQTSSAKQRV